MVRSRGLWWHSETPGTRYLVSTLLRLALVDSRPIVQRNSKDFGKFTALSFHIAWS